MAVRFTRRWWGTLVGWVLVLVGVALATAPALQWVYGAGWQAHLQAQLARPGPDGPGGDPGEPAPPGVGPAGRIWASPAADRLLELLGRWLGGLERLLGWLRELLTEAGVPEGWLAWWWEDPGLAATATVPEPGELRGGERLQAAAGRGAGGARGGAAGGREAASREAGQPVARLVIPRAGVDAVVLYGTSRVVLARGPGIYQEAELPGPQARVAIAAHRTTYGAWFRHIDRLQPGDALALWYQGRWYRYTARRVFATHRNDWRAVLEGPRPGLILTTCHPPGSSRQRLVVYAELTGVTP
ncbi:class E sortase [Thermaerobacter sp. PB12/4term]|uniref:class E sortase n=1 Tax=Thermaerobacter sp. PB12/4term TaxID=2293838 RepID=UPI0013149611|nr:class E sortase [Thermaerobacter sp. PB12/4term]QIA27487.1 class E sortase [Thermaerobacter sp. PB12/4term]